MEVPSLQTSTLIKLAVTFWTRKDMKKCTVKQLNGTLLMENCLDKIKKIISDLPLSLFLKKDLTDIVERVGYELFVFVMKNPLNECKNDLHIHSFLNWTSYGAINRKLTYECYFEKNSDEYTTYFACVCSLCDEDQIKKIWNHLSYEDKDIFRNRTNNLLVKYWVYFLENNLNEFVSTYGRNIIGFEPFHTIERNMLTYCLNFDLKPALFYFLSKLPPSDELHLTNQNLKHNQTCTFLKKILKNPKQEHFKYICSFLEMSIVDPLVLEIIVTTMPNKALEEFIDHLLRLVNIFGDLHYNIFCRVIARANPTVKKKILLKLDFYALNLLARGRFQTFQNLLPKAKPVLFEQLCYRLKQSKGLALFFTICKNNQKHLLIKYFKYLSKNEEDEMFFNNHLQSILNGTPYD